ncbi:casparian strip membrane protein 2-like [Musa acuminata AAA Group]|uniref:CASP-like protein n=1 Tax=Musa acuminata subsp. malaccensis TaxID=214687 RepID=A0A804K412_MUSAM|nr:PREDICTED: casparian strip membrane protein 2-like [Musa acuminata subsp. malaccensis]CAG1830870.1 unnamed protein product [Musa acuminata subsp. malaccensis]
MNTSEATAIANEGSDASRKAPLAAPARFPFFLRKTGADGGWQRGVALFEFILRLCGIAATLVAAITMGTTNETLPFFTEFFQFHANFADLPALTFFVVANAIAAGYLVLSLPFSLAIMVRPRAIGPRLLLFICDTVMVALTTAAASAAAAIVYLAHNGDAKANWIAICLRFDGFCQRISGAVVASFIAVVFFFVLVVMSALVMRKH